MENLSLLYPQGKEPKCQTLGDAAVNDLSLDYVLSRVAKNGYEKNLLKGMMLQLESDPATIRYRRDVFEDIMRFPALRERITATLDQLDFLKTIGASFQDDSAAPIWQLLNRLRELEVYIKCITEIYNALNECPVQSEGLRRMKAYVASVYEQSGFEHLSADIDSLLTDMDEIRSITLGVNLDSMMRPVEVGILSINHERFDHRGILQKFNRFIEFLPVIGDIMDGKHIGDMTKIHTSGVSASDDPLMQNLSRAVTDMLAPTVKQLKNKLSRYVDVSGYSLTRFMPEFIFYIRWADFCAQAMQKGLPMSKPEILDCESKSLRSSGVYDIKLAVQALCGEAKDIIRNDFEFTREHGIYIMTGPNRGGKTTFTQAVGWLFLLAQNGIYVPAESLSLSPCDNIFTHFPADENQTVNLGRLGEESKRISEIFAAATDKSLLLFNESLATTSFTEGLYIAKDVVRALRCLGARTVFNTHMHELATDLDEMNTIQGDLAVASLITGIHEGQRSYKVYIAPPEGISYARDIAEKYGVTFAQLMSCVQVC